MNNENGLLTARLDYIYRGDFYLTVFNNDHELVDEFDFMNFDLTYQSPDGKWMAFIANLKDGKRVLVRQKLGGTSTIISKEGVEGVKNIEFFSPSINDSGHLAFRGIGEDGRRHIYFAGANVMTVLLSENQKVSLNQGEGVIYAPEGPSFGGKATLNNKNQILVRARVFKIKGQVDLGQALFRVQGPKN